MKTKLWNVTISGSDSNSEIYSVLAASIVQAMAKAVQRDKGNWKGDARGRRRMVTAVELQDKEPVL